MNFYLDGRVYTNDFRYFFLTTYADISKAQRAIEYNPQVSLKEGIQKFVNWYKYAK
jgi:nucleoside-diphosphate-sugar epimerase